MGNLLGSGGGGGGKGYGQIGYGPELQCCKGVVDPITLLTMLGLITAITLILRQTSINKMLGRKKRGIDWNITLLQGLEEFENKVDQIAAGNEENSWISQLYNKFNTNFLTGDDKLTPEQLDGMEPPMLDETWGLEDIQRLHNDNSTEPFMEEMNYIPDSQNPNNQTIIETKSSRKVKGDIGDSASDDQDDDLKHLAGDQKCSTKFWRCIGNVVKGGAHYLQEPGGITNAIQKSLFRVAFHGGFGNVWGALMSIPEARQVKKCMNQRDDCLSYEILKQEANATLDDSPRIIVNPDFVERIDQSDGAFQFDPEDQKKFDEAMGEDENEIDDEK